MGKIVAYTPTCYINVESIDFKQWTHICLCFIAMSRFSRGGCWLRAERFASINELDL